MFSLNVYISHGTTRDIRRHRETIMTKPRPSQSVRVSARLTFCLILATATGSFLCRISYDVRMTSLRGLGVSSTFPAKNMHIVATICKEDAARTPVNSLRYRPCGDTDENPRPQFGLPIRNRCKLFSTLKTFPARSRTPPDCTENSTRSLWQCFGTA